MVMSLSERSWGFSRLERRTGEIGGGESVVMGAWCGGERWTEFFRIPRYW